MISFKVACLSVQAKYPLELVRLGKVSCYLVYVAWPVTSAKRNHTYPPLANAKPTRDTHNARHRHSVVTLQYYNGEVKYSGLVA